MLLNDCCTVNESHQVAAMKGETLPRCLPPAQSDKPGLPHGAYYVRWAYYDRAYYVRTVGVASVRKGDVSGGEQGAGLVSPT